MTDKTYLCGGINGLADGECRDWREVAKALLRTETIDPMRRDYRGREDESVEEIVEHDLQDIEASRFILVNATRASWGTAMEVHASATHPLKEKRIVCFVGSSRVSPWLRYFSEHICATNEEACAWINERAL